MFTTVSPCLEQYRLKQLLMNLLVNGRREGGRDEVVGWPGENNMPEGP